MSFDALVPASPRRSLRVRLARGVRVRVAVARHVLRRIGPLLVAVLGYSLLASLVLRFELRRAGRPLPDLHATLYAVYTQLFLEHTEPFPTTPLARAVFWITPIVGLILVAEGLLKVGASLFDVTARQETHTRIMSSVLRDHVVVCGLGHVGLRVVQELRRLGEDVVAIELRQHGAFVDHVRALGVPVHVGDGRRDDLLVAAGAKWAKAVVCATDDDLANLEISIDAKRMNPAVRVVMRMFDQGLAAKVGGALELDECFSTSSLAAPLIAIQAMQPGVRSAYRLDDVVRVTAEITAGAGVPATVDELEEAAACRVVCVRSTPDGPFRAARASERIEPGDALVVDVAAADLPAVRERLGRG